jgi:molybdate transport system substrate-binding protein
MKAVTAAYEKTTGTKVTLSFGASNTLAQQFDQGVRADHYMSADSDWMDFLQKNNRIRQRHAAQSAWQPAGADR